MSKAYGKRGKQAPAHVYLGAKPEVLVRVASVRSQRRGSIWDRLPGPGGAARLSAEAVTVSESVSQFRKPLHGHDPM